MKVLAFDIGIVNLAYCIMTYDKEKPCGSQFPISGWNVIDLLDNVKRACSGKLKNGNDCKNLARFEKNDKYYCQRHKIIDCQEIVKNSTKGMAMHEFYLIITKKFDEHPEFLDVDTVILELQGTNNPRFNNVKMKVISTIMHQYFVIRGMIDTQRIKEIKYLHAKTALSFYKGPEIEIKTKTSTGKEKGKRQIKKEMGLEQCKYLIREDQKNLNFIVGYAGKKFDLSDAFLLGGAYLSRQANSKIRKTKKTR